MLRDIVRDAVAGQSDMDIVRDRVAGKELRRPRVHADVVIVGVRQPDDLSVVTRVLGSSTGTTVLAIAHSGRSATMWQLQPHRAPLGEVSPQSLVAAIRAGVERR